MSHTVNLRLLIAVICLIPSVMTQAATVTVTSAGDGVGCTLRNAVRSINLASPTGGCSAIGVFGSSDEIRFSLNANTTIQLVNGSIAIDKSMAMTGPGADSLTITPAVGDRVFTVTPATTVPLSLQLAGLRFAGSRATVNGGVLSGTGSAVSVSVQACVFDDNHAREGGVFMLDSIAALSIRTSEFTGNQAQRYGAVLIMSQSSDLSFTTSSVTSNVALQQPQAVGPSGAIFGGVIGLDAVRSVSIREVEFVDNGYAQLGLASYPAFGGVGYIASSNNLSILTILAEDNVATYGGAFAINRVNVQGFFGTSNYIENEATQLGGALYLLDSGRVTVVSNAFYGNISRGFGGAVFTENVSGMEFINSTFHSNTATDGGGALKVRGDGPMVTHATMVKNSTENNGGAIDVAGANMTLQNSVLLENRADNDGSDIDGVSANFTELSGNMIGDGAISAQDSVNGLVLPADNIIATLDSAQPLTLGEVLRPLALNGATYSLIPVDESVVIDSADVTACLAFDQRGRPRNDGACDIGAIEFKPDEDGMSEPATFFVIRAANGKAIIINL